MLDLVSTPVDIAARAIVLQIDEHAASNGLPDADGDALDTVGQVAGARMIAYLLTLTVMPDDEPPFRSKVEAGLPADARWQVRVGAHVPVTIAVATRDVRLDTAALQALSELM
jgi:hypothetical protein